MIKKIPINGLSLAGLAYLLEKQSELKIDSVSEELMSGQAADSALKEYLDRARNIVLESQDSFGPFVSDQIRIFVEDQLERYQLKRQVQNLEERLTKAENLAIVDPLTELYNRRFLEEALKKEIGKSKRDKSPIAAIMIDIDNFKDYNDSLGHPAGDKALRAVAQVIAKECREMDYPCRYGGEEFLVLLPQTTTKSAYILAERIRKGVVDAGINPSFTISLGVASLNPSKSSSKDLGSELVNAADQKLYLSKQNGKNKVSQ